MCEYLPHYEIGSSLVAKVTGNKTKLNTNENNNLILILIKVSPKPVLFKTKDHAEQF